MGFSITTCFLFSRAISVCSMCKPLGEQTLTTSKSIPEEKKFLYRIKKAHQHLKDQGHFWIWCHTLPRVLIPDFYGSFPRVVFRCGHFPQSQIVLFSVFFHSETYLIRRTLFPSSLYSCLLSGQIATLFASNFKRWPYSLIHPRWRAGFYNQCICRNIFSYNRTGTYKCIFSDVMSTHYCCIGLIVAPFPTSVFRYWFFRTMALLGLFTFVNTMEGPRNTSSSQITPVKWTRYFEPLHFCPGLHPEK